MSEGDYLYKQGDKIMAYMARFKTSFESNLGFRRLFRKNIAEIYEEPKTILDAEEKAYFEAVIRPFKDRFVYLTKTFFLDSEYIEIALKDVTNISEWVSLNLPRFKPNTMYKGMELHKKYTLKELGLFEEEGE